MCAFVLQRIFRDCGVVAVRDALNSDMIDAHWKALRTELDPYLASRQRVVESMLHVGAETKHAGYDGYKSGLAARWRKDAALRSETALTGGYTLRERSAGRIDLQLPYIQPWNDTDFTSPSIILSVIQV